MASRFVNDVRRGSVHEMRQRAHVRADGQDCSGLEFLEGARRDEAVDAHGAPPHTAELLAHVGDTRDPIDRDSRGGEPVPVRRVRGLREPRLHLQQHEAPYGLVYGVILLVVLLDDEAPKVARYACRNATHARVYRAFSAWLAAMRYAWSMRLATLRDGSRDGTLILVDDAARHYATAGNIAPTLQAALDDWARAEPELRKLSAALSDGRIAKQLLDETQLSAPLPRAYEWIDGSSYLNHILLVRKARGAEPPVNIHSDPLVYQGGSGVLLGPRDPLSAIDEAFGLDFEGEVCVVLGDVPQGTTADRAAATVRLLLLANDVTYRNLVAAELAKGFGFFVSKPATAFSPFAVTPDELGPAFRDGRVFLRLRCTLNGELVGDPEAGPEMHFSFYDLIAHIARTRAFTAGTLLGSGTVSNVATERGVSCLAERRTREVLESGAPTTEYLKPGDTVRIEMLDSSGRSVFGAIEQRVVACGSSEGKV